MTGGETANTYKMIEEIMHTCFLVLLTFLCSRLIFYAKNQIDMNGKSTEDTINVVTCDDSSNMDVSEKYIFTSFIAYTQTYMHVAHIHRERCIVTEPGIL